MRWLTNFYDFRFKWTTTAGIWTHPTKTWLSQLVNFKNAIWAWGRTICNKILFYTRKKCHAMKAGSTAMTQRPRDRVASGSMLALPDPRRPDRANPPTNFWWSLFWQYWHIYMHWVPTGQAVNKEYYVRVLREFRKRFHRKRLALLKSGEWHFHRDNAPVHNSILVIDYFTKWASRQFPSLPLVQTLLPVTFGHWHAHTRWLPWGLPEVVGTLQQVHCSRWRLFRKGLEFHVCIINKSAHTKKLWKLI